MSTQNRILKKEATGRVAFSVWSLSLPHVAGRRQYGRAATVAAIERKAGRFKEYCRIFFYSVGDWSIITAAPRRELRWPLTEFPGLPSESATCGRRRQPT